MGSILEVVNFLFLLGVSGLVEGKVLIHLFVLWSSSIYFVVQISVSNDVMYVDVKLYRRHYIYPVMLKSVSELAS